MKSFSRLQSLVQPEIILADSVWITSNYFLESDEQLFHTESLSKAITLVEYIWDIYFFNDYLLTINIRTLKRLSLVQAFLEIQSNMSKAVTQKRQKRDQNWLSRPIIA